MTAGKPRHRRASLRPRWELAALAVLYVAIFVLRDAGVPLGIDFDLVRSLIVLAITLLTLRVVRAPRAEVRAHLALATLVVASELLFLIAGQEWLRVLSRGLSIYLIAFSALALLVFLLRRRRVSGDALVGALAVYLAVGVLFGLAYTTIAVIDPGAFVPPQTVSEDGPSKLFYFSYVTLTTLGYGDISPAVSSTRILTALEAVVGVVLLAVLVGRIVGMLISQQSEEHLDRRIDELARSIVSGPRSADDRIDSNDGGDARD